VKKILFIFPFVILLAANFFDLIFKICAIIFFVLFFTIIFGRKFLIKKEPKFVTNSKLLIKIYFRLRKLDSGKVGNRIVLEKRDGKAVFVTELRLDPLVKGNTKDDEKLAFPFDVSILLDERVENMLKGHRKYCEGLRFRIKNKQDIKVNHD
jgi:hypothetical protein